MEPSKKSLFLAAVVALAGRGTRGASWKVEVDCSKPSLTLEGIGFVKLP